MTGLCQTGTLILKKMVIIIEAGIIKANELNLLKEYDDYFELTTGWACHVLPCNNWIKTFL